MPIWAANGLVTSSVPSGGLDDRTRCPNCRNPIESVGLAATKRVVCTSCAFNFRLERDSTAIRTPSEGLSRLDRFELIEAVGEGAFGTVYRARDPQLDRLGQSPARHHPP